MPHPTPPICHVGIYRPKFADNVGTLLRSVYQMGADAIFTIGHRYTRQKSDTYNVTKQIPISHYDTTAQWLHAVQQSNPRPVIVGIEISGKTPLSTFVHPSHAIYLFGAEDEGLPEEILSLCDQTICIESVRQASYNLAVAGSLVLYQRMLQYQKTG